jgi:hypothetical protein
MVSFDEDSSQPARSGDGPAELAAAYGPITLRRYAKDDGRALILYSLRMPRVAPEEPETDLERIEDPRP